MQTLDTRELSSRLDELNDLKTNLENVREELAEIKQEIQEIEAEIESTDEIESLENDLEAKQTELEEKETEIEDAEAEFGPDEETELEELEYIASEISGFSQGEIMITESDFTEYCQELCEDIGDIPRDIPGYIVIDWDATANNLRSDYSTVNYQGEEYLVRNC